MVRSISPLGGDLAHGGETEDHDRDEPDDAYREDGVPNPLGGGLLPPVPPECDGENIAAENGEECAGEVENEGAVLGRLDEGVHESHECVPHGGNGAEGHHEGTDATGDGGRNGEDAETAHDEASVHDPCERRVDRAALEDARLRYAEVTDTTENRRFRSRSAIALLIPSGTHGGQEPW